MAALPRAILLLAVTMLVLPRVAVADEEPAAAYLWTDRDKGLTLLEDSLEKSPPGSVERWSLYVEMLDVNDDDDFADWASRTALRLHPDDPTLLKRRIALLDRAPALDLVARLAAVPGHAEEAGLIRDTIRLGLSMPGTLDMTGYHAPIARRLLYVNDPVAALRRVEEGLAGADPKRTTPEDYRADLLATKAMALAMLDRFDEAMAAQKAAGFPQIEVEGHWQGLGDLLLARGKKELSLASFGEVAPERRAGRVVDPNAEMLRVYALVLEANGRADRALKLLDVEKPELWDRLLAIRILLRAGRPEEAVRRGREIADPLPEQIHGGSFGGPQLDNGALALSLRPEYRAAAGWLGDTFVPKAWTIRFLIGDRNTKTDPYEPWFANARPSSELIPSLRARLAAETDAAEERRSRRILADALFDAGRFAEAAEAIAPSARAPRDEYGRLNHDAVTWSIYSRQAEAEAAYLEDPDKLTPARRLFAALAEGTRDPSTNQRIGEAPGVADKLIQMGPAVLAPAMRRLSPWEANIGHFPHAANLPVVAALAEPRDAPLLIALLPKDENATTPYAPPDALDAALRKITGVNDGPDGSDPARRLAFWLAWWDANGPALVGGA